MQRIGKMLKCDGCGKIDFVEQKMIHTEYGMYEGYEDKGWIRKTKIKDRCPECAEKLYQEVIQKYHVSKALAKCHFANWQDAHACHKDSHHCPNYEKCVEIWRNEDYGTKHPSF